MDGILYMIYLGVYINFETIYLYTIYLSLSMCVSMCACVLSVKA